MESYADLNEFTEADFNLKEEINRGNEIRNKLKDTLQVKKVIENDFEKVFDFSLGRYFKHKNGSEIFFTSWINFDEASDKELIKRLGVFINEGSKVYICQYGIVDHYYLLYSLKA